MEKLIINQNIKINLSILELNYDNNLIFCVEKFTDKLEPDTKKLVFLGSIFFLLLYFLFLIFLPKKIQFKILNNLPIISKIFHFYRKIILASFYENEGMNND